MVTKAITALRYASLIVFLVVTFARAQENDTVCEDNANWCDTFTPTYCDIIAIKQGCPKSCNNCLPPECRKCEQNCSTGNDGFVSCTCFSGFRLQSDGLSCEDINECLENENVCPEDLVCHNSLGNFSCDDNICTPFYSEDYMLSVSYKETCCKLTNRKCGQTIYKKNGTRIIGGEPALAGMWPWMVYLPINGQVCGGSLLSSDWVISAAHCFKGVTEDDVSSLKWNVYLGVLERTKLQTPAHQKRAIAELIRHENYAFPLNDVALVRMDRPAIESDYVRPICLPNGEVPPDGTRCVTTGFGLTDPDGTTAADVLQQVNVPIVNSDVCRRAYEGTVNKIDTDRMVCAGYQKGEKDSCSGDSGGPLVCQRCDSCDWFLAGVTSFGEGCAQAGYYGVYSNVEFYEKWIESKIDSVAIRKRKCTPAAKWAGWGEWSKCSRDCGGGSQSRSRVCVGGEAGSPQCPGVTVERQSCNDHECGGNFWAEWSTCSKTCGSGLRTRQRVCVDSSCQGEAEIQDCNIQPCPSWRPWSPWGDCSASCAGGETVRTRSCKHGKIGEDGCSGSDKMTKKCNEDISCSAWGSWSSWSKCPVRCGGGKQSTSRQCIGGIARKDCRGRDKKTRNCNTDQCSTFETEWTAWSTCTLTCGGGTQTRTRSVLSCNPSDCTPDDFISTVSQDRECNPVECVGTWSSWSMWSQCSETCNQGERKKTRVCENGLNCPGESEMLKACMETKCLSVWAEWGQWADCSATCGQGERTRTRACGNQKSDYVQCTGEASETESCEITPCQSKCEERWCVPAVRQGFCVTNPAFMYNACDISACCNEEVCQDLWAHCAFYGNSYCYQENNPSYQEYIKACTRTCGYCSTE